VDELHAAIADFLRGQRRPAEVRRPLADAERQRTQLACDARILAIWRARRVVPVCTVCGRLVDDDGGLFNLSDMQLRRQCVECYCPF